MRNHALNMHVLILLCWGLALNAPFNSFGGGSDVPSLIEYKAADHQPIAGSTPGRPPYTGGMKSANSVTGEKVSLSLIFSGECHLSLCLVCLHRALSGSGRQPACPRESLISVGAPSVVAGAGFRAGSTRRSAQDGRLLRILLPHRQLGGQRAPATRQASPPTDGLIKSIPPVNSSAIPHARNHEGSCWLRMACATSIRATAARVIVARTFRCRTSARGHPFQHRSALATGFTRALCFFTKEKEELWCAILQCRFTFKCWKSCA